MAPLFVGIKNLNWFRFAIVVGACFLFWQGLATIVPPKIHSTVLSIIGALQAAVTFVIRASKYVETRQEIPRPGEQP